MCGKRGTEKLGYKIKKFGLDGLPKRTILTTSLNERESVTRNRRKNSSRKGIGIKDGGEV